MQSARFSGDQVSATWERVMLADDRTWRAFERSCGPFQDHLTGMVAAFTLNVRPEVGALARELMVCVYEVYREHGAPVRSASKESVLQQLRRSRARIEEAQVLVDAGESVELLLVGVAQPALYGAVLAVLEDPGDEDEFLELSESEFWQSLAVCDTVMAVLGEHAAPTVAA